MPKKRNRLYIDLSKYIHHAPKEDKVRAPVNALIQKSRLETRKRERPRVASPTFASPAFNYHIARHDLEKQSKSQRDREEQRRRVAGPSAPPSWTTKSNSIVPSMASLIVRSRAKPIRLNSLKNACLVQFASLLEFAPVDILSYMPPHLIAQLLETMALFHPLKPLPHLAHVNFDLLDTIDLSFSTLPWNTIKQILKSRRQRVDVDSWEEQASIPEPVHLINLSLAYCQVPLTDFAAHLQKHHLRFLHLQKLCLSGVLSSDADDTDDRIPSIVLTAVAKATPSLIDLDLSDCNLGTSLISSSNGKHQTLAIERCIPWNHPTLWRKLRHLRLCGDNHNRADLDLGNLERHLRHGGLRPDLEITL